MLKRRDFLKLSGVLAAGTVASLASPSSIWGLETEPPLPAPTQLPPIYRIHGHARSGCAYRPELAAIWSGGGAQLPEFL
jgi:hypothetical protein